METLVKYMSARAEVYNILSAPFYKEVTKDMCAKLNSVLPVVRDLADFYQDAECLDEIKHLEQWLTEEVDEDRMAGEFARLFLGVNKASSTGHTITPHESVYTSASRLVMQKAWEEVYEVYYNQKLGKNSSFKEPEDHITAEMSFMAYMSRKCSEHAEQNSFGEVQENMKEQIRFLSDHLCTWVNLLDEDIYKSASLDFYKSMSKIIVHFLSLDKKSLKDMGEDLVELTA